MPRRTLSFSWSDPAPTGITCHLCCAMTAHQLCSDIGYPHAETPLELEESVDNGCRLCTQLFQNVDYVDYQPGRLYLAVYLANFEEGGQQLKYRFEKSGGRGPFVWESIPSKKSYDKSSRNRLADGICVYTDEGDPAILLGIPSRRRHLTNTASASTFEQAKRWIHECINTHCCGLFAEDDPHCLHDLTLIPKPTRKMILPSRLIQLDAFDPGCFDARLVDVNSSRFGNFCPPYAALTYCWGDDKPEHPHRTVGSNLMHRMQHIDYSQLPRTIQDAFTIARKLGVDYLWVDALCIVQDSNPDWHGESAKMGGIYEAAIFTIAADGSRDNDDGIFNEESIPQDQNFDDGIIVVRNTLSNGQQSTLRFWVKPWMFYIHDGHQEPEIINQSQTSQRGWCCQERMLSTRILHFTETQLFWECQHQYQSEDGFVTWNPGQDTVAGILPQIPGPMYDVNGGGHASACELKWYNCIIQNDFSKREVRCPWERLIALSGIATMLSAKMDRPYLAGMWYGNTLVWALSWERASHTPARILVGAPSFSWASVNVRVRWPSRLVDFNPDSHLKLNDYKVRPSTQNKFGTVDKCYVNVTGLLKEATIQKPSTLREQQYTSRGSLRSLDRSLVGSAIMDHRQDSLSDRVTCLLLGRSLSPETGYTWHVLLLKPKEGVLDGYSRVGAGEIPMGLIDSFPSWFSDACLSSIYIH